MYEVKGEQGFLMEMRGKHGRSGRPRTKDISDTYKIKRLEIENAYLKAENDFLVKLRAAKKRQN